MTESGKHFALMLTAVMGAYLWLVMVAGAIIYESRGAYKMPRRDVAGVTSDVAPIASAAPWVPKPGERVEHKILSVEGIVLAVEGTTVTVRTRYSGVADTFSVYELQPRGWW